MRKNLLKSPTTLKEALIKRSYPDLYRSNALRYLDLPAFSTMRDINKRKQIIEICKSTGASIPKGLGINLLHQEVDYSIDLNQIIEKFKNPINHLVEEFFWFWPNKIQNIQQDLGLNFLACNESEKAMITWETQSQNGDPYGIALHNVTILKHCELIEMYLDSLKGGNSVSIDETKLVWEKSFQYWQRLLEDEAFWSFLSSRVRDFDDPRLTTGNVRRLRALLPLGLILINIRLALSFAEARKFQSAKDIVILLQEQDFEKEIFIEASQLATEPIIKRLNYLSSSAAENIDTKRIKANLEISQFLDQGIKMLDVLEVTDKFRSINEYKDQFAETVSKIAINYGYLTQNDKTAIELLEKIKTLTQNLKTIDDADFQIKFFKDRISKGNYWCSEGYHNLDSSTYNSIETARKSVNQKKYDKAQNILENLLNSANNSGNNTKKTVINTCLAFCLNMQAIEDFDNAVNLIDYVPTFVQKVADRLSYAEKEIGVANWAADNNKLAQACYENVLQCMACGNFIFDINNVYTFKWKDLTYVGCYSCTHQYDTEWNLNTSSIKTNLSKSLQKLNRGYKINSKNKQIKENLDFILPIAQSWGVNVQEYSPNEIKPKSKRFSDSTKTYSPYISSTSNKKKIFNSRIQTQQGKNLSENNTTMLWIVFAVILFVMFMCIVISFIS